ADRAQQSGRAGHHRPALDRGAAGRAGHHEKPRPLVSLSDWHTRDPRHADAASCVSLALADRQAARLARHAGDQEGARLAFRPTSRIKKISPPTASTSGKPVSKAKLATVSPKSAKCCENFVAQVTPTSLIGGHWPLTLMTISA